jgi:hypothetical protein
MGAAAFRALAAPLEPEALAVPLEPEALVAPLGPDAPMATHVVVAATVRWDTVFLLSFTGLVETTSVSDGRFRLAFPRDAEAFADSPFFFPDTLGCLTRDFPTASAFLFL